MKKTDIQRIVREELISALAEQEQPQETDKQNTEIPDDDRFSQAEKAFLGKFAEKGSQYLGILYSKSPSGIEEFINRSADQLNLTMDVFQKLLRDGVIAIEQYGGYGRNEDYTIKLNLDLQGVEQYRGAQPPNGENGGDETADIDTGGDSSSAPIPVPAGGGDVGGGGAEEAPEGGEEAPEGGEEAPEEAPEEVPEPEAPAETILKYGDILNETARTAKRLIEQRNTMSRSAQARVYADKSRMLKRLPTGYLRYLERIIEMLGKRLHNDNEREHLVADILDNMAHNFGLTPRQIMRSYVFYRTQNRLKNVIGEGVDLLSEQKLEQIGDTQNVTFKSGHYKAEEIQNQLESIAKKIEQYMQDPKNTVTDISISASESKVPNNDAYTGERMAEGDLAKKRSAAVEQWMRTRFPKLQVTVQPTKIGTEPWPDTQGMSADQVRALARDDKYTKDQWVHVSAVGRTKPPVEKEELTDLFGITAAWNANKDTMLFSKKSTQSEYSAGYASFLQTMKNYVNAIQNNVGDTETGTQTVPYMTPKDKQDFLTLAKQAVRIDYNKLLKQLQDRHTEILNKYQDPNKRVNTIIGLDKIVNIAKELGAL